METTQNPSLGQLKRDIFLRDQEILQLKTTITFLEEQLEWFKRQIFGKRSERIIPDPAEQQTFDFGLPENPNLKEETKIITTHQRRKPKRQGQNAITLPSDLPVKTTFLDVPEKEKICPKTGVALIKIGEEKTQKLAHTPGSYYIKEIIRPKYAHKKKS